jgi:hypothetical protein
MRALVLKTHIFVSKIPKSTPETKSGAPRITFFYLGLKLQQFATTAFKSHNVVNTKLKINP